MSTHTHSQQVSWWSVHEYVLPDLEWALRWPTVGTPEWVALDDDDPINMVAIMDAAQHWALRLEAGQESKCEASRDISAVEDWSKIAQRQFRRLPESHIPRKPAS
jgi:hypothetical protein